MPLLIKPDAGFESSYRSYMAEIQGEELTPFTLIYPYDDFGRLVRRLHDNAEGRDVPPGFVANTTYWLIDDRREIVGVSNLRHTLTPELERFGGHVGVGIRPSQRGRGYGNLLMELTLIEALKMDIDRILVTCNKGNKASARIIVNNGGELDSEEFLGEQNGMIQRYWIDLAQRNRQETRKVP